MSISDLIQGRARSQDHETISGTEEHPPQVPSVFDWEPQDGYCQDCGAPLTHDTRARTWACLRCLTIAWVCDESCGTPRSSCRWLMSQQNIDKARAMAEAFIRGDSETAIRGVRADAVWHNTAAFPGPTTCMGPEEIVAFWNARYEDFDPGHTVVERITSSGDTVVALVHSRARGKISGAPVDVRWAMSARFAGGEIVQVDIHGDQRKALAAAGLSNR